MPTCPPSRVFFLYAALALCAAPARAKVVFTGYGAFRFTADQWAYLGGNSAALATFGLSPLAARARGFRADAVGLFATTSLTESTQFLVDFTYSDLAQSSAKTRLQYAYLEYVPGPEWSFRAGRQPLPFGYYNEHRFYPFQRAEFSAPFYLASILGLPIADVGVRATRRLDWGWSAPVLSAYAVNGYGTNPRSASSLRAAALPGAGITMADNLKAGESNAQPALGGQVELDRLGGRDATLGLSFYSGYWDSEGERYLNLGAAHARLGAGPLSLLAEYTHLSAEGDVGMAAVVGEPDWRADAYFVDAGWRIENVRGAALTPYARLEKFRSRAQGKGGSGRERLEAQSAGVCVETGESIRLSLELLRVFYALPVSGKGVVTIDIAHSVLLGLRFTF